MYNTGKGIFREGAPNIVTQYCKCEHHKIKNQTPPEWVIALLESIIAYECFIREYITLYSNVCYSSFQLSVGEGRIWPKWPILDQPLTGYIILYNVLANYKAIYVQLMLLWLSWIMICLMVQASKQYTCM